MSKHKLTTAEENFLTSITNVMDDYQALFRIEVNHDGTAKFFFAVNDGYKEITDSTSSDFDINRNDIAVLVDRNKDYEEYLRLKKQFENDN